MKKIGLLFFLFSVSFGNTFVLSEIDGLGQIGNHAYIFKDTEGNRSIEEVSSVALRDSFSLNESRNINIGYSKNPVWLRLSVENRTGADGVWMMGIGVPSIHNVTFFVEDSLGAFREYHVNFFEPRSNRNYPSIYPAIPVQIKNGEISSVYIRIMSESSVTFPVLFASEKQFMYREGKTKSFLGFYFGALFIVSAFSFFLFVRLKTNYYLYYVLFVFNLALGQMFSVYGSAYDYLPFGFPVGLISSVHVMSFLSAFFAIKFSRHLLNTSFLIPIMDKVLSHMSKLTFLICVISPLLSFSLSARILSLLNILISLSLLWSAVITSIKGFRPAYYYLSAGVLSLVGIVLYNVMYSWNLIPFSSTVYFLPNVGVMITALLLLVAVVERIKISEAEYVNAQKRFIDEQQKSMEELRMLNVALERFVPTRFLSLLGKKSIREVELGDYKQENMTVLFSDIRSFTMTSELMSPHENFQFLNRYLGGLGPIIRRHRGFIDKFYGDGIMALFPDSPSDALYAAVEMQRHVMEFNAQLYKEEVAPIRIGIGIHTGKMVLGTIGEMSRMDGTVISDAVNISSHLEALTKKFHASIIVSDEMVHSIGGDAGFTIRMLGNEMLKGRKEETLIYEILDSLPPDIKERRIKNKGKFEEGVRYYYSGNKHKAKEYFEDCQKTDPTDYAAFLYIKRISEPEFIEEIVDV